MGGGVSGYAFFDANDDGSLDLNVNALGYEVSGVSVYLFTCDNDTCQKQSRLTS